MLKNVVLSLKIRIQDQAAYTKLIADDPKVVEAFEYSDNSDHIASLKTYLKKIQKNYPFCEYIFVSRHDSKNTQKQVIADSSDISQHYPPVQRFGDGKKTVVGEIFSSPFSKLRVFILSSPIIKDGKILGSFHSVIRFDEMSDMILHNAGADNIGEIFFADKINHEKLSEKYKIQKIDLSPLEMTQQWYAGIRLNTDVIRQETGAFLQKSILILTLLLIFFGAGILILTHIFFVKPIRKAAEISTRLADYDFTVESDTVPDNDPKNEICRMLAALTVMTDRFRESIMGMSAITRKLVSSINDISGELNDQASIASEQSASVSQITATMAELSSSFTQIAEHSDVVAKIAEKSLQNTKAGAEAVKNVMAKMEDIHNDNQKNIAQIIELGKKSKEISKVMEIIHNVADRTKLIAFNAALEASSAGEAGKRFGVVAMEIRRLADNVMESTDDIESNINEIQTAIENMIVSSEKSSMGIRQGLEYSTQTAGKLTDIVNGSQSTVDAARQISLSTQQQRIAGEQVLIALREIDKGAEQGSLSIAHISSISRTLTELAEQLQQIIDKFVVKR